MPQLGSWWDDIVEEAGKLRRSVVNIEGDCLAGQTAVEQMLKIFDNVGKPKKYEPAVKAVADSFHGLTASILDRVKRNLPFSPVCGQMYVLGQQATALTKQMATEHKIAMPEPVTVPMSGGKSWVWWAVVGAAVAGGVYLAWPYLKKQTTIVSRHVRSLS